MDLSRSTVFLSFLHQVTSVESLTNMQDVGALQEHHFLKIVSYAFHHVVIVIDLPTLGHLVNDHVPASDHNGCDCCVPLLMVHSEAAFLHVDLSDYHA